VDLPLRHRHATEDANRLFLHPRRKLAALNQLLDVRKRTFVVMMLVRVAVTVPGMLMAVLV